MEHSNARKTARKMTIVNIAILGGGLLLVFTIMPRGVLDKVKLNVFQCDHGRYTVLFPPDPVCCSRLNETENGIMPFICMEKDSSHFFYRVGYTDYPDNFVKEFTVDQIFKKNINDLAEKANGRIVESKTEEITVSGFEGRQYDVKALKMSFRVRFIIADNRLYQVLVSTTEKNMEDDRINQILRSFYIHK